MKSIFGSAPLLPCTTPAPTHPFKSSRLYRNIQCGAAGPSSGKRSLRTSKAMMGADLILWDDWSISIREQKAWTSPARQDGDWSDSGPAEEEEECKDLKEVGHHFLPGCVCSWIRLPHVAPEARGAAGTCSSVVALQCATRDFIEQCDFLQ